MLGKIPQWHGLSSPSATLLRLNAESLVRLDICLLMNTMRNVKAKSDRLVLVVDDDPSVRRSTSRLLTAHGFSVMQAENGQRALDALKHMRSFPCLVVLDMAMPVMDGRGFLKERAQDPLLRDIPVVVVSGSPQSGEPLEGISAYLSKPLNVDRLVNLIHQHC
jgi:CheY-like chemotaxis protein